MVSIRFAYSILIGDQTFFIKGRGVRNIFALKVMDELDIIIVVVAVVF